MVFLLSDGENVSMMVGNFIMDFFKEARLGSMIKIPKLGLGSGSTLEARARLGLEKCGLVPPLVRARLSKLMLSSGLIHLYTTA